MTSPQVVPKQLVTGDRMDREEFLRVWEQLPSLKHAELIDGVVHVPSPVSNDHGRYEARVAWWVCEYVDATPGCDASAEATWMLLGSVPQPDVALWILPESGGQSRPEGKFRTGPPELVVEVCFTSTEVDFGPKLALYQRAGVREYLTVQIFPPKRMTWRALVDGRYEEIAADAEGILKSRMFPGLWLDAAALLELDGERVRACLNRGLADPAHGAFVAELASQGR